jgi:hypothetical protein
MASVNRRRLSWRGLAAALLVAPSLSLLAAAGAVWVAEKAMPAWLPVGMHTIVPLALLVPMPLLEMGALLGLGLATLAIAGRRRGHSFDLVGAVALVAAAQVLFFIAQLLVVDQVHGIPDAAVAIGAAAVLQALVLALGGGAAVAAGMAFEATPALSPAPFRFAPTPAQPAPAPSFVRSEVHRLGSRRGPPTSLLID